MTEEEAKKKECPFGMATTPMLLLYARNAGMKNKELDKLGRSASRCSASDCMMWVQTRSQKEADAYNGVSGAGVREQEAEGHCGLSNQ